MCLRHSSSSPYTPVRTAHITAYSIEKYHSHNKVTKCNIPVTFHFHATLRPTDKHQSDYSNDKYHSHTNAAKCNIVHVGDVALEPRRLGLSGPGAAPAAFKNAAS